MPGFWTSIVLAFISEVELFDVVEGSARAWLGGESLMGGMASRRGGSKPLGCHVFQKSGAPWMKFAIKATL